MADYKRYSNRLGLIGWAVGGKWGLERYLYALHRITGLGMLLYLFLHIFVTASRVYGRNAWETWMGIFKSDVFAFGEFLVFAAFAFHAVNGIRLILIELGFWVGKPEDPVYPYRSSLNSQRPLMVVAMIITCVLVVAGGYEFFGLTP